MPRNKKQFLPPRRKRMTRQGRLESAKATRWVEKYEGSNLIKGYVNWFGVNLLCAVIELRMLGVELSEEREKEIRITMEAQAAERKRRREMAAQTELEMLHADCDDTFAYIAGYTSGGAPEHGNDRSRYRRKVE